MKTPNDQSVVAVSTLAIVASLLRGERGSDIARSFGVSRQFVGTVKQRASSAGIFDADLLQSERDRLNRKHESFLAAEKKRLLAEHRKHNGACRRGKELDDEICRSLKTHDGRVELVADEMQLSIARVYQASQRHPVSLTRSYRRRTSRRREYVLLRELLKGKPLHVAAKVADLDRQLAACIACDARQAGLLPRRKRNTGATK
jgi:hypothetical protein